MTGLFFSGELMETGRRTVVSLTFGDVELSA